MYVGGIDVGTTGCKIAIYDDSGRYVDKFYREYDVKRSAGLHQIDLNEVWDAVCDIIRSASKYQPLGAIGVTSFGETFAMLNEKDEIIAPSMIYTDPRGEEECRELAEKLGEERIAVTAGCRMHPMYSIPKIMWIKKTMPEVYKEVRRILLVQDFVVYRLTGKAQIDYSGAARTMGLDIRKKCWCKEIFDAAGIDVSLMSSLVPSGTSAGTVLPEWQKALGLTGDTVIVSGFQDQVASAVGAGAFEADMAVDGIGTVECVTFIMREAPTDPAFYSYGYSVVPYINDMYACYALSYAGGATLKWFRDTFATYEKKEAEEGGKNIYALLDGAMPKTPTGLLIMPYFAGAATPYMDTEAKATVIGLTLESTKLDIYRALMEGTSYEIALNMEILKKFSIHADHIMATGGGATSDIWLQIKADVLGVTLTALAASEVGGAGTAMAALYAVGGTDSLKAAVAKAVPERKSFAPENGNRAFYKEQLKKYADIYPAIHSLGGEVK